MPAGLQVWDQFGALTVDLSYRLSRVIGTVYAPAESSGSVTDDGFLQGTPYCICARTDSFENAIPGADAIGMAAPIISFSGNTMYWSTPAPSRGNLLIYGVY